MTDAQKALDILEEVAETLTDFVVDESVPQALRERLAPSVGMIDEFLADSFLEDEEDGDEEDDEYDETGGYYEEDDEYDETGGYYEEDEYEDDEALGEPAA